MIIAEQKPLKEILELTNESKNILVVGCGACVSICFAGGEKETATLAASLRLAARGDKRELKTVEAMTLRQCEWEFIEPLAEDVEAADVVLSTACGVGVQTMAEKYPHKLIVPALNTTSMGMPVEQGVWLENCGGCGNCVLAFTGGICPIARCAKSLMNGPCGGSQGGRCEVAKDIDCAWVQIYYRLKNQGRLDLMTKYTPAKDWTTARDGGPRRTVREDLRLKKG